MLRIDNIDESDKSVLANCVFRIEFLYFVYINTI